jgi:hypothetical protein
MLSRMRSLLSILLPFFLIFPGRGAVESSDDSPNQRYTVTFEYPNPEHSYPKIYLIDRTTNKKTLLFDFEDFGVYHSFDGSDWSPDSHYVAIGTEIERTLSVEIFRVKDGEIEPVDFLPIPAELDKKPPKIRGGMVFDHWQGSDVLWIFDTSKSRLFRYHFTQSGKLLADKYEDREQ